MSVPPQWDQLEDQLTMIGRLADTLYWGLSDLDIVGDPGQRERAAELCERMLHLLHCVEEARRLWQELAGQGELLPLPGQGNTAQTAKGEQNCA